MSTTTAKSLAMYVSLRLLWRFPIIALLLLAATPVGVDAAKKGSKSLSPGIVAGLRAADIRVAAIGQRLAIRNVALCVDQQPQTGLILHSLLQYVPAQRDAVRKAFGFSRDMAVEAVVPGSAAARAGIAADDQLVAIGTAPIPTALPSSGAAATTRLRDAAYDRIAVAPASARLALTVERAGQRLAFDLPPEPGCRVRFEVTGEDDSAADASVVQIGAPFLDRFDDNGLAVVIAHELAHVILRTKARLTEAGVSFGILSELGKSGRLHRQAEEEADRLSVYLLRNAGYDPMGAGRFWRGPGRALDKGVFRSRIYPDWQARAARLDAEAALIPPDAPTPLRPAMLALRDTPMR